MTGPSWDLSEEVSPLEAGGWPKAEIYHPPPLPWAGCGCDHRHCATTGPTQTGYIIVNFSVFSCGATIYLPLCVCLCVCVCDVPRFVCPMFITSTKAWMMPGSNQLYSGVQTDGQATILEPYAKKDSAQTSGVPVCNSIFNENFTFS